MTHLEGGHLPPDCKTPHAGRAQVTLHNARCELTWKVGTSRPDSRAAASAASAPASLPLTRNTGGTYRSTPGGSPRLAPRSCEQRTPPRVSEP